jgi:hypothetical protein
VEEKLAEREQKQTQAQIKLEKGVLCLDCVRFVF